MTTATLPIKRFRLGSITLAVWHNTDRQGRSFFATTISRSFRSEQGAWKNTDSLRPVDLPVVRSLSDQALQWLTQQDAARTDEHGLVTPAEHDDAIADREAAIAMAASGNMR
ncbi:MAG: hypothetical protein ACKVS8_11055 [Phycisphaerales bacterium]